MDLGGQYPRVPELQQEGPLRGWGSVGAGTGRRIESLSRGRRELCDGFKGSLTGKNLLLRATVRGLSLVPYSRVGPCHGSDDGSWLTVALAGVASQSPGKERRGRSALGKRKYAGTKRQKCPHCGLRGKL